MALANRDDVQRPRAEALIRKLHGGRYGQWVSTDYVLDEGLTLIQARFRNRAAAHEFSSFFHGAQDKREAILDMRCTTTTVFEEAVEDYFRNWDRRLSVTDCTLVVHARRLDAVVATFDSRLDGLVPTIG